MAAPLGDILLTLLSAGAGTAQDLSRRHLDVLGTRIAVVRIVPALTRLERLGYIHMGAGRSDNRRRSWLLTEAGQ